MPIPGTINQSLKLWNKSLDGAKIEGSEDLTVLNQFVPYNDSIFRYKYEIKPLSDTTSMVKVYVTDTQHSIKNRLTFPFLNTDFEKRVKNSMLDLSDKLTEHTSRFQVTIEGESEIEETFCAVISLKGLQVEKAKGMMQNFTLLSGTLLKNKMELTGRPFISVNSWEMKNDSIKYDFCYPIKKTDSLFEHPYISFKTIEAKKALKSHL